MSDENKQDENQVEIDVDKKIRDFCTEMSNSFLRTEAERDFRKNAVENLSELLKMSKSDLSFVARTYHKGDFDEKTQRMSKQRDLYVRIFGEPTTENDRSGFDDDHDDDLS